MGLLTTAMLSKEGSRGPGSVTAIAEAEDPRSGSPEVQKSTKDGDKPFRKQKKQLKQSSSLLLGNLNVTDTI
jgi:hypothetical protein